VDAIATLLDHLGYPTPLLCAAAAYGLFHWLDENTSDEAKAAITSTMQGQGLEADRIVSALLEIFDRIYTYPLWSIRAFRRSFFLTIVASFVTFPTVSRVAGMLPPPKSGNIYTIFETLMLLTLSLSVNILTDYVSLFYVRRWLRTAADRPVLALTLGALAAILIVTLGNLLRDIMLIFINVKGHFYIPPLSKQALDFLAFIFAASLIFSIPALIVFVWLPLFAIGILVARITGPLFRAVGKIQWFLKEGQTHPLRAVGCVAAIVVLGFGIILQTLLE
jgi:hypothetical protein